MPDRPNIVLIMTDQHRADLCAREGVTDICYYADRLPYHRVARLVGGAAASGARERITTMGGTVVDDLQAFRQALRLECGEQTAFALVAYEIAHVSRWFYIITLTIITYRE